MKKNMVAFNVIVYEKAVAKKGWSQAKVVTALGCSKSYMTEAKKRGTLPLDKLKQLALVLDAPLKDLLDVDTSAKECVAEEPKCIELPETDFEKEVRSSLAEIKETLSLLMDVVGVVESEVKNRPKAKVKSDDDRAKELLQKMVRDTGACKYADFYTALSHLGVKDHKVIDGAISSCGCITKFTGYGNNKVKWITDMPVKDNAEVKVV